VVAVASCPNASPCTLQPAQTLNFGSFTVTNDTGRQIIVSYDGGLLAVTAPGIDTSFGGGIAVGPPDAACINSNGIANYVQCSNPHGSLTIMSIPPNPAGAGYLTTTLPAGWNIVGVSVAQGLTTNIGPLYTLSSEAGQYIAVSPDVVRADPEPRRNNPGFWALFDRPTEVAVGYVLPPQLKPPDAAQSFTFTVSPGWSLVGNPSAQAVAISPPTGNDVVYTYDARSGYQLAEQLAPGQGAFLYSSSGGTVTVTLQ